MYTLYHHPYSQHARRVVALLEAASLPYTLRTVSLEKGDNRTPEFLALNPSHQVPVLLDGDYVLCESNAILRYLAGKHALEAWYPTDLQARGRVDQWLDWNQAKLGVATRDIVFNKVFMGPKGDQAAIQSGLARMVELGEILDARLSQSAYLAGPEPTLADLSIGSNITQLQFADAVPAGEHLRHWYDRLIQLPGFAKSLPPQK